MPAFALFLLSFLAADLDWADYPDTCCRFRTPQCTLIDAELDEWECTDTSGQLGECSYDGFPVCESPEGVTWYACC